MSATVQPPETPESSHSAGIQPHTRGRDPGTRERVLESCRRVDDVATAGTVSPVSLVVAALVLDEDMALIDGVATLGADAESRILRGHTLCLLTGGGQPLKRESGEQGGV